MDTNHAHRICGENPPPSGRKPELNISVQEVRGLLGHLKAYHKRFTFLFQRQEQRYWALKYMQGQMLKLERKSIEPMARALKGGNVQAMQQFINDSPWDDEAILHVHQQEVAETLGSDNGVLIIDGCDYAKQGTDSVGVARQYCGPSGKRANCQASVVLVYASQHGHTFLDRRLFLPEHWFGSTHAELRKKCRVPETLTFQTKNQLAYAMLEPLLDESIVPFQYITMDEAFGRDTKLLNKIDQKNKHYFAEIPCNTSTWEKRPELVPVRSRKGSEQATNKFKLAPDAPTAKRVDDVARALAPSKWRRVIVDEGSKGPLEIDVAIIRAVFREGGLPAREEWLILRRKKATQPVSDWKFYRCNAPSTTSWKELARLTVCRWPIESTIEEAKSELGMDHYETRSWRGWHHHTTMTILAHHFLVKMRVEMEDEAPALTIAQARSLLQVVLPKAKFDAKAAINEIQRTQKQNYKAYLSHRKKRLRDAGT